MPACPWPDCGSELEGLGRFCHACGRYTDTYPDQQESAGPVARVPNSNTPAAQATPSGGRQVLVLPLPLSANVMWRSTAGAAKGLIEAAVRYSQNQAHWREVLAKLYVNVVVSSEGKSFKKDAATWMAAQPTQVLVGDVRLKITFYFERRGSDLDNRLKPLLDVLQKVLYTDDKQVSELHAVKRYDKEKPRCVVVAEPDDGSTQLDPGATFNYALEF